MRLPGGVEYARGTEGEGFRSRLRARHGIEDRVGHDEGPDADEIESPEHGADPELARSGELRQQLARDRDDLLELAGEFVGSADMLAGTLPGEELQALGRERMKDPLEGAVDALESLVAGGGVASLEREGGTEDFADLLPREGSDVVREVRNLVGLGEDDVHRDPHAEGEGQLGQARTKGPTERRDGLARVGPHQILAAHAQHHGARGLGAADHHRPKARRLQEAEQPGPSGLIGRYPPAGFREDGAPAIPEVDRPGGDHRVATEDLTGQQLRLDPRPDDGAGLRAAAGPHEKNDRKAGRPRAPGRRRARQARARGDERGIDLAALVGGRRGRRLGSAA